jgi:SAM-dependent methyltransferase
MATQKHQPNAAVSGIARTHLDRGDPLGWFEEVYRTHRDSLNAIPWADFTPNDLLISWLNTNTGPFDRACVVGCGLGDDAVEIAWRFSSPRAQLTAFDLSPTAIEIAAKRSPELPISWEVGNLLALPEAWNRAFDFIFEAYTLQSLPESLRRQAFENVAALLAPGGKLVIVARLREASDEAPDGPPWPLTLAELVENLPGGICVERVEEFQPSNVHPSRRIRVTYTR